MQRHDAPAEKPLPWVWKCHICKQLYQVGVTRRCLIDGHYFCSGTMKLKRSSGRKIRHHEPCPSEFDFELWQKWGDWRREEEAMVGIAAADEVLSPVFNNRDEATLQRQLQKPATKRNCWELCNFPSECRHGALKANADGSPHFPEAIPNIRAERPNRYDELMAKVDMLSEKDADIFWDGFRAIDPLYIEMTEVVGEEKQARRDSGHFSLSVERARQRSGVSETSTSSESSAEVSVESTISSAFSFDSDTDTTVSSVPTSPDLHLDSTRRISRRDSLLTDDPVSSTQPQPSEFDLAFEFTPKPCDSFEEAFSLADYVSLKKSKDAYKRRGMIVPPNYSAGHPQFPFEWNHSNALQEQTFTIPFRTTKPSKGHDAGRRNGSDGHRGRSEFSDAEYDRYFTLDPECLDERVEAKSGVEGRERGREVRQENKHEQGQGGKRARGSVSGTSGERGQKVRRKKTFFR